MIELMAATATYEELRCGYDDALREARPFPRDEVVEGLRAALIEAAAVLEALNMAGGTGVGPEIASAVTVVRSALGIKDDALRATETEVGSE